MIQRTRLQLGTFRYLREYHEKREISESYLCKFNVLFLYIVININIRITINIRIIHIDDIQEPH